MTQMIYQVEKGIKIVIITLFHLLKELDERLRHGRY